MRPAPLKCKNCKVRWMSCVLKPDICSKTYLITDKEIEFILQMNENLPTDEMELQVRDMLVMEVRERPANRIIPTTAPSYIIVDMECDPIGTCVDCEESYESFGDKPPCGKKHDEQIHQQGRDEALNELKQWAENGLNSIKQWQPKTGLTWWQHCLEKIEFIRCNHELLNEDTR